MSITEPANTSPLFNLPRRGALPGTRRPPQKLALRGCAIIASFGPPSWSPKAVKKESPSPKQMHLPCLLQNPSTFGVLLLLPQPSAGPQLSLCLGVVYFCRAFSQSPKSTGDSGQGPSWARYSGTCIMHSLGTVTGCSLQAAEHP